MKKNFGLVLFLFMVSIINAQQNISMLLLDEKNMNIQQKDVNYIYLTIWSPDSLTSIYSEFFISPKVVNGIVNLKTGEGKKDSMGSYSDAIRTYYNSLPPNKRPTSESFLVVKIEVNLKNGTAFKFYDDIKFNTPVPLVKGDSIKGSYLSDKLFLLKDDTGRAEVTPRKLSYNNNYTKNHSMVTPGLMGIYHAGDRTVIKAGDGTFSSLDALSGKLNFSNIHPKGITLKNENKSANILIDGINWNAVDN